MALFQLLNKLIIFTANETYHSNPQYRHAEGLFLHLYLIQDFWLELQNVLMINNLILSTQISHPKNHLQML